MDREDSDSQHQPLCSQDIGSHTSKLLLDWGSAERLIAGGDLTIPPWKSFLSAAKMECTPLFLQNKWSALHSLMGSRVFELSLQMVRQTHRSFWRQLMSQAPFHNRCTVIAGQTGAEPRQDRRAASWPQEKSFVTGLAFTSSRGWLRWLCTIVSGSIPQA